ncbi:MAG: alpha-galactosidase [Alistipes sp.]|nr:alpha-galactosidase [Candidatus Alistipes equi]
MKRLLLLLMLLALFIGAKAKTYYVSTPNTMMVLDAKEGGHLYFRYYGEKATLDDVFSSYRTMKTQAFRVYGTNCTKPHAALVKFQDGDNAVNAVVTNVTEAHSKELSSIIVTLQDTAHPLQIRLHYDAYQDCDVMKLWAEYINLDRKKSITLQKYMSASLPVKSKDCALLHLNGYHGDECNETVEKLTYGTMLLSSQEGSLSSAHTQGAFMLGTDGYLSETEGSVIGGALSWTGNFHIEFNLSRIPNDPLQIYAGVYPVGADYTLSAKNTLRTPELILTYSNHGKGTISRNLHRWARRHQILEGTHLREVLLNSWEGVHMDVSQQKMNSMMSDFAELGGEMFVMDDGWFGEKYPRDTGSTSLGDWKVAKNKLPQGINALIEVASKKGLKFGLWVEPEMVNTKSELYEKHPDWVLRHPAFTPTYGRGGTQLLLDLTNPKVQDFVVNTVLGILNDYPGIQYIKWDHNMSILNASSLYLPKALQSNLQIEYHKSLASILRRIRDKYPTLAMQLCSSGGYRLNYGYMPYFQEVWTSDQTDALHRIYIQWGALNFYPSNILAAHVCSATNKYTQRRTPLKFRFDVASMCRLGMEMVPSDLSADEKAYAKRAIASYQRLRPVIQQGDLYRIASPYDTNGTYASLMYVNEQRTHAVAYFYRTIYVRDMPERIFKLQGLDPAKRYLIREVSPEVETQKCQVDSKIVSGKYLMDEGIVIRELTKRYKTQGQVNSIREINDYRSVVLELIAQ